MSDRSLPVIVAVVVSLLLLSACSTPGTTFTDGAARYVVLGVLALIGTVIICLALGMNIPTPWGTLRAPEGRVQQAIQGLLGCALLLSGVGGLFMPIRDEPSPSVAMAPQQDLGTANEETPLPSPQPPPFTTGSMLTVTDLDNTGQHVISDVYLIDNHGKPTRLGETTENGDFMIRSEHQCVAGSMIQVLPHRKYGPGTRYCPSR